MKSWNPFGKVDMEVGSFLKASVFNKNYMKDDSVREEKDKENSKESNKENSSHKE